MSNISQHCSTRLQKEYRSLLKDPVPNITAHPASGNILEWHFVLEGAADSEYEGGVYHGKLTFPPQYPFKPPSICVTTPNGRFATNTPLCLSMTNFHPETWNPMWRVGTILSGLLSFMSDNEQTAGSIVTPVTERRKLAKESLEYNIKKNPMFRKLFPEWVEVYNKREEEKRQGISNNDNTSISSQQTEVKPSSFLSFKNIKCIKNTNASLDQKTMGETPVVQVAITDNSTPEDKVKLNKDTEASNGTVADDVQKKGNGIGRRLTLLGMGIVFLAVVLSPIYTQKWGQWMGLGPEEKFN
uniref:UBC core domain-containing protein n=1 Tax=Polytomella parva TaxID=51329 RepID=A0A7S0UMR0_9CHLO|mmetsp:Transcript_11120/g.20119  ORF Transcript_11120/g.20119 Transcript_11120/m.20119 type:complete len:299 (+) Transcript_11120:249-1145(+)|eukprot:CAMPEP_0175058484 /NCGR_PEP_ID=MMETSP0052_2-20121109/11872_1 /TAXON_ID=51329 ORGANISM="Polytomella parva, Strain SAG 63-3" /NCGR_SAMPLE_ID=MMETSP0052_2 /ASSEMBLY_ACC=CAM_ASM_000194 /LENGTH=298 /DNA_ID=CAMNT_0016323867 /DNA_START=230 /DNA_END=1126 /DNA_ORIENTATION=-